MLAYTYKQHFIACTKYQKEVALRNIVVLELLFSTGMRVSEISNLKISAINFGDNTICIFGKGSKERIMCINDNLSKTISNYLTVRSRKTDYLFKYGDIGVILADEIRNDTETYPCKVITELDNPIRATVIGAGQFSMDISGSTIQYADVALPIKNLPCIESLERVSDKACAICIRGEKSPSFKDVDTLSEKIVTACKELINNNTTLVVILKEDFSKALGQCLRRRLPPKYPFICLDGIECKSDDYIDIGEPIAGNKAVPVVVKTLVFGGKKK